AQARRLLRLNDHGDDVRALQTHLAQLGYVDAHGHPLKADGNFGPNTRFAVEAFQRDHHLAVDGKVGAHTQAALDQVLKMSTQHAALLSDPRHPDHLLFRQALAGVHRFDAQMGRTPDQHSDNLAGALSVAAKAKGLSRIDDVAMQPDGERAFAAQNHVGYSTYADVATMAGIHTPLAKSSAAALELTAPAPMKNNPYAEVPEPPRVIHDTAPELH
ncbi:MAG: XVIPCD domain-containing protein, partial [Burkholderiales bacterium]